MPRSGIGLNELLDARSMTPPEAGLLKPCTIDHVTENHGYEIRDGKASEDSDESEGKCSDGEISRRNALVMPNKLDAKCHESNRNCAEKGGEQVAMALHGGALVSWTLRVHFVAHLTLELSRAAKRLRLE